MLFAHSLDLLCPNSLITLANHLLTQFHKLETQGAYPIGKFDNQ